jgi:hypothetical protein
MSNWILEFQGDDFIYHPCMVWLHEKCKGQSIPLYTIYVEPGRCYQEDGINIFFEDRKEVQEVHAKVGGQLDLLDFNLFQWSSVVLETKKEALHISVRTKGKGTIPLEDYVRTKTS